ncbi:MAG: biotin--[Clostridia bacterium]|nr:biotin--[acetyl-CoA-carboxylase] ligase [Clostridia bacterium]
MKKEDIKIITLSSVTSTNDYLKNLAKDNETYNIVVIAEEQTNGKGTRGRSFISQKGGIYLSILLRTDLQGFDATAITPLTAVAVSDAIEQISGKKSQIKWVNDIYLDNKKVCGILCESVISSDGKTNYIIVGIGVNLFKPTANFDDSIKDIATYVFEEQNQNIREEFISLLLENFFKYYNALPKKSFFQKYRERNLVIGKKVFINSQTQATALDIDNDCRLIVELPDKTKKALSSGDVTVKL